MPPKKPRPADTGGVPKPVRTGTLTGETPVKEHIKKIEKNGGKGAPKKTASEGKKENANTAGRGRRKRLGLGHPQEAQHPKRRKCKEGRDGRSRNG